MSKYYFANNGEMCYVLKYWEVFLKMRKLNSIKLYEAKRVINVNFFYCDRIEEVVEKGNCGKECKFYKPRNKIKGICVNSRNTYEQTDKILILKSKESKLADKIIKEMQDFKLTPDQMLNVIRLAREKYNEMKKKTTYTYSYCTEDMINDTIKETDVQYPDVMGYIEYEKFEVKANNLQEANEGFLEFQQSLGKIFEIEDDVEMDIKADKDEDRYIQHGLKQDWDTHYFEKRLK